MKIETRFMPLDRVVTITRCQVSRDVVCATCDGAGHVSIRGRTFVCPGCRGRRTVEIALQRWVVNDQRGGRIALVIVEARAPVIAEQWQKRPLEVSYQLHGPDGPSSINGRTWPEADAFVSLTGAQAECDARNAALDAASEVPTAVAAAAEG